MQVGCPWGIEKLARKVESMPYTSSAGEHSASSRQAVHIPSKTIGNSSIHLGHVRRALREAFNFRRILSTRPFAWGC